MMGSAGRSSVIVEEDLQTRRTTHSLLWLLFTNFRTLTVHSQGPQALELRRYCVSGLARQRIGWDRPPLLETGLTLFILKLYYSSYLLAVASDGLTEFLWRSLLPCTCLAHPRELSVLRSQLLVRAVASALFAPCKYSSCLSQLGHPDSIFFSWITFIFLSISMSLFSYALCFCYTLVFCVFFFLPGALTDFSPLTIQFPNLFQTRLKYSISSTSHFPRSTLPPPAALHHLKAYICCTPVLLGVPIIAILGVPLSHIALFLGLFPHFVRAYHQVTFWPERCFWECLSLKISLFFPPWCFQRVQNSGRKPPFSLSSTASDVL